KLKVLHHPHQRLVGRAVAVRMILAENVTDYPGALDVWPVPDGVGLVHRKKHAAVNGFESVADVRQGPAHDHAHCVIEIGMPHFGFEAYRKGFFGELLHRRRCSLSVKRLQSGMLAHVCKGTAESCCRGHRSLPGAQALKTNNFIMTVVLLRHLPSSCCKNRNTAWQGQNPHAIVGWKSPFSTATKKHCRQAENERAKLNNSSQRGERDENSSDCNHRDRRHCRHVGLRGVWPGKPAEQRICLVWIWHPCQ